jgi:hypothetical protein
VPSARIVKAVDVLEVGQPTCSGDYQPDWIFTFAANVGFGGQSELQT